MNSVICQPAGRRIPIGECIEKAYDKIMPVLLESSEQAQPLSIHDVAAISRQLADDLSRLTIKSEGFTVEDYLSLDGPYFVEFIDGRIQVLPMPDAFHQSLMVWLVNYFRAWLATHGGGKAQIAAFKVFLRDGQYREPDVCLMLAKNAARMHRSHWEGADLVVEIISKSNRLHDIQTKRVEYAANGIPEYWIVDPENRRVSVLKLDGSEYKQHGDFASGDELSSPLLEGLKLDVKAMFDEAEAQA